jgi:hypothetical protein
MLYQVQQVDGGYQIFRQITIQEYPPEIVSVPLAREKYASRDDALARLKELNRGVEQQLGRVVEITVQCENAERAQTIQAACTQFLEPLQGMLEFLTFTDAPTNIPSTFEEQPHAVRFLMRLLEPTTHPEADQPLRGLLSQFLELEGTTKAGYSFWIVEIAE